jgi:hypothetical protein
VSADYPGAASGLIESTLGGVALFTRGSCGNIHPLKSVEQIGTQLGTEVLQQVDRIAFRPCDALQSIKEEIALPLRELDPEQMREVDWICEQQSADPAVAGARKDYFRRCYRRLAETRHQGPTLRTFLHLIRIGAAVLVGIPGEQFVEAGLEIKRRSPFQQTFLVDLANDSIGYIPTRRAYAEGGYQTWIGACNLAPEAGEMIVERAVALMEKAKLQ